MKYSCRVIGTKENENLPLEKEILGGFSREKNKKVYGKKH